MNRLHQWVNTALLLIAIALLLTHYRPFGMATSKYEITAPDGSRLNIVVAGELVSSSPVAGDR